MAVEHALWVQLLQGDIANSGDRGGGGGGQWPCACAICSLIRRGHTVGVSPDLKHSGAAKRLQWERAVAQSKFHFLELWMQAPRYCSPPPHVWIQRTSKGVSSNKR